MKGLLILILFIVFSLTNYSISQDYFPLKIGNSFVYLYEWSVYYPYGSNSGSQVQVMSITDTITNNGKKYFYCSGVPAIVSGWVRVDPVTKSLYKYDPTNSCPLYFYETLIDSLGMINSGMENNCISYYCYGISSDSMFSVGSYSLHFSKLEMKNEILTRETHRYYNKLFGFKQYLTSYDWGQSGGSDYYTLRGCRINGVSYGDSVVTLEVETNRNSLVNFSVNNVTYNTRQSLTFLSGKVVNVRAISPSLLGTEKYTFVNWSDGGDTSHNVIVTSALSLTAFYKAAFKLVINTIPGSTFGGNTYYDSAVTFSFGVNSRRVVYNGRVYNFKGWTGTGMGAYTSPDSSGTDTVVTMSMNNYVVEFPRWQSTVGIANLSNDIPDTWKLNQNYPNPFNPITNVKFSIVKSGEVKLVVYDIQGREVQTLVNESLKPGTYEAAFDGSALNSGVYFYKLITNAFTETKKMILIK